MRFLPEARVRHAGMPGIASPALKQGPAASLHWHRSGGWRRLHMPVFPGPACTLPCRPGKLGWACAATHSRPCWQYLAASCPLGAAHANVPPLLAACGGCLKAADAAGAHAQPVSTVLLGGFKERRCAPPLQHSMTWPGHGCGHVQDAGRPTACAASCQAQGRGSALARAQRS